MATKPTELPEWATDETNNTEPSAGQKATGWNQAQKPPSSYFNWWQFTVWLWIEWLNAAEVDFGTATVRADDMIVDDDLTVTGQVLDDLELDANKHVIVSGTGRHKHGDMVLVIPAGAGENDSASTQAFAGDPGGANAVQWAQGNNGGAVNFAICLPAGKRIKEVRAMIRDTAGGNTMEMRLWESTNANGNTQRGATQTSAGGGTNQTLALTGLTLTIATGLYFSVVVKNLSATTTTNAIYGVEVTYDHP